MFFLYSTLMQICVDLKKKKYLLLTQRLILLLSEEVGLMKLPQTLQIFLEIMLI